jgi:hypothetical protein
MTRSIKESKMIIPMRSIFCAACVAGLMMATATVLAAQDVAATPMTFGDGSDWKCLGGQWTESEGVIRPPDKRNLHSRAFYVAKAYDDVTVEFEYNPFYREQGAGDAGLILRAGDGGHFYYVSFPWVAQQTRAKHFWAAVAKVSGDGYQRYVKLAWVPNVRSENNRWYKVKVEAKGNEITVWVDGRYALTVTDDTYKRGFVGLAGYGWYWFRNVRITGRQVPAPSWDESFTIPKPAVEIPVPSAMPSGGITPNGDVLILCGKQLMRSKDKGRTWLKSVSLPQNLVPTRSYESNMLHCMKSGRVIIYHYRSPHPPYPDPPKPEISMSESADNGLTWSDPKQSKVADGDWFRRDPEDFPYGPQRPYGRLIETADGALVSLIIGTDYNYKKNQRHPHIQTWGAFQVRGASIRSTDGGASWSGPVELDQPVWNGNKVQGAAGTLDLTEASGVAIGNTITSLVRPIYSPMMWQCWSRDGGVTWEPAVRAPFPGYAQAMLRLESGPILVAKRFPLHSINVSYDDGVNWDQGTVVDYPVQANGFMVEVEPDIVLCTYQNAARGQPLLAQRIRVTPQGIFPVK